MSSNKLNGDLPTELATVKTIKILDLSSNELSGTIPSQVEAMVFEYWYECFLPFFPFSACVFYLIVCL
jgi:hypothetical protein